MADDSTEVEVTVTTPEGQEPPADAGDTVTVVTPAGDSGSTEALTHIAETVGRLEAVVTGLAVKVDEVAVLAGMAKTAADSANENIEDVADEALARVDEIVEENNEQDEPAIEPVRDHAFFRPIKFGTK